MGQTMQIILLLLSAGIFVGFLIWARIKYGMTFSISAIYYKLRDDDKEWVFPAVMIGFTAPIILLTWGHSAMSIAGVLIIMSGLTGNARDNKITERNHWIGATSGMFFAGLQLFLWGFYGLVALMAIQTALFWILKPKNHTYFLEFVNAALTMIAINAYFSLI